MENHRKSGGKVILLTPVAFGSRRSCGQTSSGKSGKKNQTGHNRRQQATALPVFSIPFLGHRLVLTSTKGPWLQDQSAGFNVPRADSPRFTTIKRRISFAVPSFVMCSSNTFKSFHASVQTALWYGCSGYLAFCCRGILPSSPEIWPQVTASITGINNLAGKMDQLQAHWDAVRMEHDGTSNTDIERMYIQQRNGVCSKLDQVLVIQKENIRKHYSRNIACFV